MKLKELASALSLKKYQDSDFGIISEAINLVYDINKMSCGKTIALKWFIKHIENDANDRKNPDFDVLFSIMEQDERFLPLGGKIDKDIGVHSRHNVGYYPSNNTLYVRGENKENHNAKVCVTKPEHIRSIIDKIRVLNSEIWRKEWEVSMPQYKKNSMIKVDKGYTINNVVLGGKCKIKGKGEKEYDILGYSDKLKLVAIGMPYEALNIRHSIKGGYYIETEYNDFKWFYMDELEFLPYVHPVGMSDEEHIELINGMMKDCKYLKLKALKKCLNGTVKFEIDFQNTKALPRGKFIDNKLKIFSYGKPAYYERADRLYICGDNITEDTVPFYINEHNVNDVINRVISLNKKLDIEHSIDVKTKTEAHNKEMQELRKYCKSLKNQINETNNKIHKLIEEIQIKNKEKQEEQMNGKEKYGYKMPCGRILGGVYTYNKYGDESQIIGYTEEKEGADVWYAISKNTSSFKLEKTKYKGIYMDGAENKPFVWVRKELLDSVNDNETLLNNTKTKNIKGDGMGMKNLLNGAMGNMNFGAIKGDEVAITFTGTIAIKDTRAGGYVSFDGGNLMNNMGMVLENNMGMIYEMPVMHSQLVVGDIIRHTDGKLGFVSQVSPLKIIMPYGTERTTVEISNIIGMPNFVQVVRSMFGGVTQGANAVSGGNNIFGNMVGSPFMMAAMMGDDRDSGLFGNVDMKSLMAMNMVSGGNILGGMFGNTQTTPQSPVIDNSAETIKTLMDRIATLEAEKVEKPKPKRGRPAKVNS